MRALAIWLASALAVANPAAGAATPAHAAVAQAKPVPVEFGVPGEVPVDRLWADFLARVDEQTIAEQMQVAEDLYPKRSDAAACKAGYEALQRAARRLPVSFATWFVLHSCAQALDDTARAQQSEAAMAALMRHAFAGLPPDMGRTAIPVFRSDDAYAMVIASGDDLFYSFYDLDDVANGIPLVLGLRDRQTGRERELRFDFVSPVIAARRLPEDERYPDLASAISRATIKSTASHETSGASRDTQALMDADDDEKKMAAIHALARGGNYGAAMAESECIFNPDRKCGQQAVDDLLPLAEKGLARPMVLLARSYAKGVGVKQDAEAAKTLLRGAAKRVGECGAWSLYLAERWQHDDATPIDAWVFDQLARCGDAGDPYAALSAATYSILGHHDGDTALTARERTWLQLAERHELADAAPAIVSDALHRKDWPTALSYERKWADRNATVAADLASAYEDGDVPGLPRDAGLASTWRRRAGMLGDVYSMRLVAAQEFNQATPASHATGMKWLYSAVSARSVDGAIDLADALTDSSSDAKDMKAGVEIYRGVIDEVGSARARRGLAQALIDGRGVDKDPAQARQLLLKDATAGDTDSQIALAQAILQDKFGKGDPAEAWAWVRKVDAKGDASAREMIAGAMFSGIDGLPLDRRGALKLMEDLFAKGENQAGNDLAWYLCTGPDASLRDPARGLAAIKKVVDADPIAAFLDTQASCQAASGDFAQAVDTQQRAIALVPPAFPEMAKALQERLAMYRRKQAYIEVPKPRDAAAADPSRASSTAPSKPAPPASPAVPGKPPSGG